MGIAALAGVWRRGGHGSIALDLLRERLGVEAISLHRSGREALRVALRCLADRSGRDEVVLPAYTCFSVPSAVVAAGLRVRLVDVDEMGRIDPSDLDSVALENAAALVVCSLFGLPEPIGLVMHRANAAGTALVDDAAQSLGARDRSGPVGGRGEVGVLSFARGKPVGALGGGALAWSQAPPGPPVSSALQGGGRIAATSRALAFDLALWPPLFRLLAALPALGIGETHFDPDFPRGPITAGALALLEQLLPRAARDAERRARSARELALAMRELEGWRPLVSRTDDQPVYPRLAVLAPSGCARDRALEALTSLGAGASKMYPSSIDAIPELRPNLVGAREFPGARSFASRILTLPTDGRLRGVLLEQALGVLRNA